MIYDAIEQCYTVTAANLLTDLAALGTAKSVTVPATITIVKRHRAEVIKDLGVTLPALGIYAKSALTQAQDQLKRDTLSEVVWDYYAEGTDPAALSVETELVAEALLKTIDRLAGSGAGVFGGGELPLSVRIVFTEDYEEAEAPKYWRRMTLTAPVHDRDENP